MRAFPQADDRQAVQVGRRQGEAGQVGHVGHQADLGHRLRERIEHVPRLVVAAQGQGDKDVFDPVAGDQVGQVGRGPQDVEIARPAVGLIFNEAESANPHPACMAQRPGGLPGHAAGAHDDRSALVKAAAAQVLDHLPTGAAGTDDSRRRQDRERQHRRPRVVRILRVKRCGHYQEGQQQRPLQNADQLLAKAAKTMDLVLPGQMIGGDRQLWLEPQERLAGRDPVRRKPHIVSADPGHCRQEKVPNQEPDGQNLAAALEHGCPHPWG